MSELFLKYCNFMIEHDNKYFRALSIEMDKAIDYESISLLEDNDIKNMLIEELINVVLNPIEYDNTSEFHVKYSLLFVYKYLGLLYDYCEMNYWTDYKNISKVIIKLNKISCNNLCVGMFYCNKEQDLYDHNEFIFWFDGFNVKLIPPKSIAREHTILYLQQKFSLH